MGLLSSFEGKMEDAVEGAAERMGGSTLSPVQIAKKAEKQMRREKMVGAGKQYAPTLYTILISYEDDARMFGYYPTLAGETETYLAAKAVEHGLVMDGQPLVRFIADEGLKRGRFEIIAEMVAAPLIRQLRQEEMERYGIATPRASMAFNNQVPASNISPSGMPLSPAVAPRTPAPAHAPAASPVPSTMTLEQLNGPTQPARGKNPYIAAHLYDKTNNRMIVLTGNPQVIGRESNRDIMVPDINASRAHAQIQYNQANGWILVDLGSTNGTLVNGRPISSVILQNGDLIVIGTTDLEFRLY